MQIKTISIIGAGNVASNIAKNLINKGYIISQLYNRTEANAIELANEINAKLITHILQIETDVDLIIVSISDNAIDNFLAKIDIDKTLIVHTSGSISVDIFNKKAINYGVFYPLQTFTKNNFIDLKDVPICIEANNKENVISLKQFASILSNSIYEINSEQRKILHLSAVFACNFTNHMYNISSKILENSNLDFNILKPLIKETANRIEKLNPSKTQTGPAIRNDKNVINKHIELLDELFKDDEKQKNISKLYSFVSEDIILMNDDSK